eukprot:COSAG02_NODE_38125_length_433_cov_0.655689_1_plen_51_part_10
MSSLKFMSMHATKYRLAYLRGRALLGSARPASLQGRLRSGGTQGTGSDWIV